MITLTPEQLRAVERRDGPLMVRAGAGTGKTTVLVERFVRAVTEDGSGVESILAITFTEKAAAEMRSRVRERFLAEGRRAEARAAESAWIATIHGLCARILRAHAVSAGVDPEFRVLDELEAERLALRAFDEALGEFMGEGGDPVRIEMVAAYTPDRLRDMVRTAHSHLRSRGERRPRLEEVTPPRPAGERERLGRAAATAALELGAAGSAATVLRALEAVEAGAALLDRLPPGEAADARELEDLALRGRAKALDTHACDEYRDALAAFRSLCLAEREARDHAMLRGLLELYGERYELAKRARSGLDFEDLELIARDVLSDEGVRESWSGRFDHVLVDEFQDTNRLQNELLGLLSRNNLFRVGDENQSIYRFRNADVSLFREHWEAAAAEGRAESITVNFRARGEVIDAIDLAFERTFGTDYEPLREGPGARSTAPRVEPCVELIAVDRPKSRWAERFEGVEEPFGPGLSAAPPWRAAEARLLAARIDALVRHGLFAARDVVILLRATTAMGLFERALDERGIPVHVVGGRGYWGQQQVSDLRAWLSALANPLDGLAVYSVLASPLAGLSLDAVALIGLYARRSRRDPWWAIQEADAELAGLLPEVDRRRLEAFRTRFERERRVVARVSLETLIDRALTLTGYDRHVLALPGGDRRMANVRKLMRMAREYEADEGRNLRGFVDSVADRDAIQAREGEAPLAAESIDAVRMMTVHRAKGLEFPVVCLADLGKEGRDDDGSLRISEDGSVGLRLAGLGGAVDSERLERMKAEGRRDAEAEERRIFYVAATRAQEHLILSGATDLAKRPEPSDLAEPMRWIWRGLCAALPEPGDGGAVGVSTHRREGREVRVRYAICTPETVDEVLPSRDRAPAEAEPSVEPVHEQPVLELGAPPAPRALPVSRLSYTGLEAFRRCGYRFYLQRGLRLAPVEPPPGTALDGERADQGSGMTALVRGSIVHGLLERLDFRRPLVPGEAELREEAERYGVTPAPEELADLHAMVERVAGSAMRERIAAAERVRTELPFAFTLVPPWAGGRSLLMNGVVDVLATEREGTLVVDWKSDSLEGRDPEALCAEAYSTQRLVYALAALRSGAERVEVAHVFLERPDEPAMAEYVAEDADRLEAELLAAARGVVEGRFEPSDSPHAGLCADCPGRGALCSHGPELTLRPPPGAVERSAGA